MCAKWPCLPTGACSCCALDEGVAYPGCHVLLYMYMCILYCSLSTIGFTVDALPMWRKVSCNRAWGGVGL
jgi:hypothetical protein